MLDAISVHIGLNRVDPNHYNGRAHELLGCENDAVAMCRIAERAGFTARILTSEDATSKNVRTALRDGAAKLSSNGFFLVTFAGHGVRLRDAERNPLLNLRDEKADRKDEAWCLFDRLMRDDEICGLLAEFKPGQRVLAVLDCCHAASTTDARGFRNRLAMRTIDLAAATRVIALNQGLYQQLRVRLAGPGNVGATFLQLAACDETSSTPDGPQHGAFTASLLKVLSKGTAQTYDELHLAVGNMDVLRRPILSPTDESTREFRAMRPFIVHPGVPVDFSDLG
ncbi:MAG TPA: caspase family protein [Longimicrobium sp.]|nr:caspase family protein [Longimicrobium sp.]